MRILLIDDHVVVREGLKHIIGEKLHQPEFGEAGTADEARRLAREQPWDLVLLDLSLGTASGLDVLKDIKHDRPKLPVLILTIHPEEQFAQRAFRAGADGYVNKAALREELFEAIGRIAR